MEPVSLLILCFVISAVFVGKTAEGVIHAAKGTTPPSLERLRTKLAAEQHRADLIRDMTRDGGGDGVVDKIDRPYDWNRVLRDASNLAAMVVGRALQNRQGKLAQSWRDRADRATDRLMDSYRYGPKGSATAPDPATPPAGAGDPGNATPAGAQPAADGTTMPPAAGTPDAVALDDDDRLVIPPQTDDDNVCNFADIVDEKRQLADRCTRAAADNHLRLCPTHITVFPQDADVVASFGPYRCQFVHKTYTHAELRCTGETEPRTDVEGGRWSHCARHRAADPAQLAEHLRGTTTPPPPAAPPPPGAAPAGPGPAPLRIPCNLRDIDPATSEVTICDWTASPGDPHNLCPSHARMVPAKTDVTDDILGALGAGPRCTWTHKMLPDGRRLRCTERPDTSRDPDNKTCAHHTITAAKPKEKPTPPPPTCGWTTPHSVCNHRSYPGNPWRLCADDAQRAAHSASHVNGGEYIPDRCDWLFKALDFGYLRCTADVVGPTNGGGVLRRCCAEHGGIAPKPADDTEDGNQAGGSAGDNDSPARPNDNTKEETGDQPSEAACTSDVNCKSCVLVGDKRVCRSNIPKDIPDEDTTNPTPTDHNSDTDAEPAAKNNVIPFPKIATGDTSMTSTEASATANSEINGLSAAMNYTQDSVGICEKNRSAVEELNTQVQQLHTAVTDAANGIEGAIAIADTEEAGGPARDELETARDALNEAAGYCQEIQDLMVRLEEALVRAGGGFDASHKAFEEMLIVKEAYAATNNNAGSKRFVTDGAG